MSNQLFVCSYADEECGCPVEEWIVHGVDVTLHFEADGTMEAYLDAGDWDLNLPLFAATMEDAREQTFTYIEKLPHD